MHGDKKEYQSTVFSNCPAQVPLGRPSQSCALEHSPQMDATGVLCEGLQSYQDIHPPQPSGQLGKAWGVQGSSQLLPTAALSGCPSVAHKHHFPCFMVRKTTLTLQEAHVPSVSFLGAAPRALQYVPPSPVLFLSQLDLQL